MADLELHLGECQHPQEVQYLVGANLHQKFAEFDAIRLQKIDQQKPLPITPVLRFPPEPYTLQPGLKNLNENNTPLAIDPSFVGRLQFVYFEGGGGGFNREA